MSTNVNREQRMLIQRPLHICKENLTPFIICVYLLCPYIANIRRMGYNRKKSGYQLTLFLWDANISS